MKSFLLPSLLAARGPAAAATAAPAVRRAGWRGAASALAVFGLALAPALRAQAPADPLAGLPRVTETLVAPPNVPAYHQVDTGPAKIVQVRLTVVEKQITLADGVKIWALTYDSSIPAPLIVVHQNDYVEVTLVNPAGNLMVHNIDFHAATGALGGAQLMNVAPGQEAAIRFKATKPGVFVYHCAPGGAMTPLHIAAGMSGAIMVLPRDGLKDDRGRPLHYDRAYYIGEQDFYVPKDAAGNPIQYPNIAATFGGMMQLMPSLTPTYIVYEGRVGALIGDHALKAKVGERVLFIHSQADRDTRVHIIGTQADYVWLGGSFSNAPAKDYQTWAIPAGSAIAALCKFREPGVYAYMNHNMTEGMLLGAMAQVKVTGPDNPDLMTQVRAPGPITP